MSVDPVPNTLPSRSRDARALVRQQLHLLGGMSRLLSNLLRGLPWDELTPAECRQILSLLSRLDSDLSLARAIALGKERPEPGEADALPF